MESPNQACAFCADRYRKITDLQKSFARIRTYAAGSIEIPDNAHLCRFFFDDAFFVGQTSGHRFARLH
jgi:UDP-N-acetylglucosamine enolpyruvyl transferase